MIIDAQAAQNPGTQFPPLPQVATVVLVVVLVVVVVVVSQTFGVPAPSQIWPAGQSPQFSMFGQLPLAMRPQSTPAAAQVVGVQHLPNGRLPGGALFTQTPPQQL